MPSQTNVPSTEAGVVKASPAGRFDQYLRVDEAARLDPRQGGVEGCGEIGAGCRPHRQASRPGHPIAQLLTEAIDAVIVGAHALAHDPRRHPNHVRVANPPSFDDTNDRPPRCQFSFLRLYTEDARVGLLQGRQDLTRCFHERSGGQRLNREARRHGAALAERPRQARRDLTARPVGDERHPLTRLDRKTRVDGITRARQQIW